MNCLHILDVVNSAAMNMGLQLSPSYSPLPAISEISQKSECELNTYLAHISHLKLISEFYQFYLKPILSFYVFSTLAATLWLRYLFPPINCNNSLLTSPSISIFVPPKSILHMRSWVSTSNSCVVSQNSLKFFCFLMLAKSPKKWKW